MNALRAVCVFAVAALFSCAACAADTAPADGWLRWTTPALADAPAFCCADGHGGNARVVACRLDGNNRIYGSFDDRKGNGQLQVFVRRQQGVIDDVRIFDGACAVNAVASVHELGALATDASLDRLFGAQVADDAQGDRLMAVSQHPGPRVLPWLATVARSGDDDVRRDAWFWIGQRGGDDALVALRQGLREEVDADVREHIVFAISQLPPPAGVNALISLVEDRASPRVLRARALFWLAQSEDPRAFEYLDRQLTAAH